MPLCNMNRRRALLTPFLLLSLSANQSLAVYRPPVTRADLVLRLPFTIHIATFTR